MNSLFLRRLTLILIGVVIVLVLGIAVKFVFLKFKNSTTAETPPLLEVEGESFVIKVPENTDMSQMNENNGVELESAPEFPLIDETEIEIEVEPEVEDSTEIGFEPLNYGNISFLMESRMDRYESYAQKNPSFSAKEVVMEVNMNLDYDFYTHIVEIDMPDDLLVLCNKFNHLPSDFTPKSLEEVPTEYHVNDGKVYSLDQGALNAFIEMSNQAKEEGISLKIISAYRTNEFQAYLYNKYKTNNGEKNADRYSARPGHSEHETGLAIDINDVSQAFENTKAFKWLQENAHDYGYILRYPKSMETITGYMYEPWHYRYVGVETATDIKSENITFDAYYALYILPDKNR